MTELLNSSRMKDQPLTLRVLRARQQAREIRSFDMLPAGGAGPHGVEFVPGQVAVLRAGDEQAYFAFASAPEDEELEFLVKRGGGAGGRVYEMKEGDRVELVDIVGHGFPLREQKGKDL